MKKWWELSVSIRGDRTSEDLDERDYDKTEIYDVQLIRVNILDIFAHIIILVFKTVLEYILTHFGAYSFLPTWFT